MECLNRVELRGVIGSSRIVQCGDNRLVRMSVVTNFRYRDRYDTAVIETVWHTVVAWEGEKVRDIDKLVKGTKIEVLGRISNVRVTGEDGGDRVLTEIRASQINIIDEDGNLQDEQ